jgi:hypothetical protein
MKHLVFIVAYNHENFIEKVLDRLPKSLIEENYEILIIDDASIDKTFEIANRWSDKNNKIKIKILKNNINYGYGGNQKIGMEYAIKNKFDTLTLLHGDGQYAPEIIHELIKFHIKENASLTLGSRMINKKNALKGRMPLYKFIGNIILTKLQNLILKTSLSEFHTGYRVYSIKSLNNCKFFLNTNKYHFDTEIIIQHIANNFKIAEYAIPTYYGDEISYVNGINYAFNILKESILYKLQKFGIFYNEKYDYGKENYENKSKFDSTHLTAINYVKSNSKILDLGSSNAEYLNLLKDKKKCYIKTVNKIPGLRNPKVDEEELIDLDFDIPTKINEYDYILLLDIVEHLKQPEKFVSKLYNELNSKQTIIASTGNISFIIIRLMLLFGFFNYGNRGILDKTHTRLFTFRTFRNLFINNFDIIKIKGIPAPFPIALGDNIISKILLKINIFFIKLSKNLFSYQIFFILKPKSSLKNILKETIKYSESIK